MENRKYAWFENETHCMPNDNYIKNLKSKLLVLQYDKNGVANIRVFVYNG